MNVVTSAQMRRIEQEAVSAGISLDELMEHAGEELARVAASCADGELILFLVGPGNNGGDGLVAAGRLHAAGLPVAVYCAVNRDLMGYSGPAAWLQTDTEWERFRFQLRESRVVVDSLLGIGQTRSLEGPMRKMVERANEERPTNRVAIAADVPTGVSPDSGVVLGDAFRADITVCMGIAKAGLFLYPGAEYAGRVEVVDVGLPAASVSTTDTWVPEPRDIAALLPKRTANSNKGTFGRVMLVSGSSNFPGAPALAARAAYRSGAGLVEIATPRDVRSSVAASVVEPIYLIVPERNGHISAEALAGLEAAMNKADAAVIGPGMGFSDDAVTLLSGLLGVIAKSPVHGAVVDADGLNALAQLPDWWNTDAKLVLTPHPGEMSRLTGLSIDEIQNDRLAIARRFARQWGEIVVLKGAGTVVASPDGEAVINPTGGPNLATGGTGDVLSGIIGGLLAQGCPTWEAAVAGVYLHGRAGDLLRAEYGDAGTLAGDIPDLIPIARLSVLGESKEIS